MNTLLQFAQSSFDYNTYTTTTTSTSTLDPAAAAAVAIFYFLTIAVSYVVGALLLGRIFKKAGVKSWIAWVPVYNSWKLLEIGGQPGYWAVLAFVPIANIISAVFVLISMYNIGLKFGKSGAFILWAIFIPIVWIVWLAFDKSVWNNSLGEPSKAVEHTAPTAPTATPPATTI